MLTQEIRRRFLQYFKDKGHSVIPSSAVVPHDDPTLLFTNAGMNQFKDVFLGQSARDYKRAASSQKCVRVGGKHNDLENVGHTSRHLTFFEMLGNFSFGDYFKQEAIDFAWQVSTEVFGFEADKIWPSVFREDDEAFELWKKYVPESRITRLDEKDNFWAMGDTGPCGPCSELYYDRGEKYGSASRLIDDKEGNRFLEFWNLVFMQYNRSADGKMEGLPKPSIDTGAGLERVISLKMGVDSVFETDVLRSIIAQVENVSGVSYANQDPAFRVIADHLRCLAFAIADGVQPSNVDRGYVLRKVLRRAVRYGRTLGIEDPFLAKVLPRLVETMGADYPELIKGQNRIAEILTTEEEAFLRTLKRGGNLLNQIIDGAKAHGKMIKGDDAFKLKDTYGFPVEEILLIAKDADLQVDEARYNELEREAKERSRSVHKSTKQIAEENLFEKTPQTRFIGYQYLAGEGKVIAIAKDGVLVQELKEGEEGMIILDQTPFYAEMGGQVGDKGLLKSKEDVFVVEDCIAPFKGVTAHVGVVKKGHFKVHQQVHAEVESLRRQQIANNHTATHLLHWALHQVLGPHVKQAGSVVDVERLRFDFSHHKALTPEEIQKIEDMVNCKIRQNQAVKSYELDYDQAQKREDIIQFFGEKYGAKVRVIDMDESKELCGGTHTSATGNIGLFRIAKESSIAAGVRRIEAVTGLEAEQFVRGYEAQLNQLAAQLKTLPPKLQERVEKLLEENKTLSQELKTLRGAQIGSLVEDLIKKKEHFKDYAAVIAEVPLSSEELKDCADEVMSQLKSGVMILASGADGKCSLIVRVSDDVVPKGVQAGQIVKTIAPIVGGSGGGKPNSAQAGGKDPQKIGEALQKAREILNA